MVFVFVTEDDKYGRQAIVSASSDMIEALNAYNTGIKSVDKGLNSLEIYRDGMKCISVVHLKQYETYESIMEKLEKTSVHPLGAMV